MAKTETVCTRVEPELKSAAEAVLSRLGLTPSDAINVFLNQVVLRKGLPFEVKIPDMSRDEAVAVLMAELKKGDESYSTESHLTLSELKTKLGI